MHSYKSVSLTAGSLIMGLMHVRSLTMNSNTLACSKFQMLIIIVWCAGVDAVLDCVGGSQFKDAMKCVKWGAHVMPIGFASGSIPVVSA